ncbi:beta-glucuronidase isoform X2 [Coccinella septempunctata]|uniref:beta-glucuronidase isoform X2 n=1 Tax=Coccinella septempunctata TaxID=41139 RepID=UPI001D086E5F|nr:beta-glucuronidase isoform X2 [Coccinella septempunctata]
MIRNLSLVMSAISFYFFALLFGLSVSQEPSKGVLYPKTTETREKVSLDGLWNFIPANMSQPLEGYSKYWYKHRFIDLNTTVQLMPIPASYNDITTDWSIRDHVGIVWYEQFFYVPVSWSDSKRVWLRFGSVSYAAEVWINGIKVLSHQIGHLPFQVEITDFVNFGKENRVTVSCDNTLLEDTIPQGKLETLSSGRVSQTYTFDFFNYAGIDRSVFLYSTPIIYIDDITIVTESIENGTALISFNVAFTNCSDENVTCHVQLYDKMGNVVATSICDEGDGKLIVENPKLWWPYLMHEEPGYQYTFEAKLVDDNGDLVDVYRLPIGIRKLSWTNTTFTINNKPIYLHGFGKHEDSDIRGKGLDLPLIMRDYNLIKWIGANAYRTSHYPYAEEIMDLADSLGIMVIDECPGVNVEGFSDALLKNHKKSLTELIRRDKNRPSVILWSAANEPRTQQAAAKAYFKELIDHIRELDNSRPVTIVEAQGCKVTASSSFVDIISFNRYNGWYNNGGNIDVITEAVMEEAKCWHDRFQKPVILQEYGGDTLEGLHFLPDYIWSEEYQVDLMSKHFQAFDLLRDQGYFIGEFIWNFADFKTAQTYTRVGGNKKGIFTRNRQPKASAHVLRKRYWGLAEILYNATLPSDLNTYIISKTAKRHEEL